MKGPGAALLADGSSVVVREVTGSDRDALLRPLLRSITGIAAALRNTG